jgi:hypothetical protein
VPERHPASLVATDGSSDIHPAHSETPWHAPLDQNHSPRSIRRLAARRGWIIAVLVAVGSTLWLGSGWISRAGKWLAGQPQYSMEFSATTLEPEPPPYIKSGKLGILETIRRANALPQRLLLLNTPVEEIARAFALGSAWVKEVLSVQAQSFPPRLTVSLAYREPVAYLAGPRGSRAILDNDAVFLPTDDINLTHCPDLLQITGWSPTGVGRPSSRLPIEDRGDHEPLLAACQLADFIRKKTALLSGASPRSRLINIQHGDKLLLAYFEPGIWVLWGVPPGREAPGETRAEEKWLQLDDWMRSSAPTTSVVGKLLIFGPRGVELRDASSPVGGLPAASIRDRN